MSVETGGVVFVVDDEEVIRDSISVLMQSEGIACATFSTGDEFLRHVEVKHVGCVLLDLRMPGSDGLAVLREMKGRSIELPVIILTGHADIQTAVEAIKAGAREFIEKPYAADDLLRRVREAIDEFSQKTPQRQERDHLIGMVDSLTPREREVADLIVEGLSTKAIAAHLGSSFNTVHNQRSSLFRKLGAASIADVVRIMLATESR